MKKTLIAFVALFGLASVANAQFRFSDGEATRLERGVSIDTVGTTVTLKAHFNTNKTTTVASGSAKQTIAGTRGQCINVYNETEPTAIGSNITWPKGNDSRLNNINQNNNVIMADSLGNVIDYYSTVGAAAMADSHGFWLPSNCYLLKDPTIAEGVSDRSTLALADRVFAVYPGMYKKYSAMFAFNLQGVAPLTDVQFDMYTYDAGTAGGTATYDLWLHLGTSAPATSNHVDTTKMNGGVVRGIYTSGEPLKTVKIAEAFGLTLADLTGTNVYFAVTTNGTGTVMNPMLYDPVIAFDDFTVSYGAIAWITPAQADWVSGIYTNTTAIENDPVSAGATAIFPVELEMENRIANLDIQLDGLEGADPATAKLRIGGIQSWNGSAWVDVTTAVFTAAVQGDDGKWSKEKLVVPAASGGSEKFRLLLHHEVLNTDVDGALYGNRFEITNGVRFYYDVKAKLKIGGGSSIVEEAAENVAVYSSEGKIFVKNAAENITVYSTDGKAITTVSNASAVGGIAVGAGAYVVTTGNVTEKVIVK